MRQQISKALQKRSTAIRELLNDFNNAAAQLDPPRPPLQWDQVVEYTFLSEFDLLSDSTEDVHERAWARPAARSLLDRYFKMERAREEIERVEIEANRFLVYIKDEEDFLLAMENQLSLSEPGLAYQIHLERARFEQMNHKHRSILQGAGLGLTAEHQSAVSHIAGDLKHCLQTNTARFSSLNLPHTLNEQDLEAQEEQEDDEAEIELCRDLETIVCISEPEMCNEESVDPFDVLSPSSLEQVV